MTSTKGMIPMPNTKTERFLGGHCLLMIGYNDVTQRFTCVNSWGRSWGNNGLCYVPYNYVLSKSLVTDFCQLNFTY